MDLKARDYRAKARRTLTAYYGMLLAGFVLFEVLTTASAGLAFVGVIILGGPLVVGYAGFCLSAARGAEPNITRLFDGFNRFAESLLLFLVNLLLIFAWSLLLIVPGIVKRYSYSMSYYLLADHPEMTAAQARAESVRIMKGHKWRLFCLELSFIWWNLLSVLTFGILLLLYVGPYMEQARAEFYLHLVAEERCHGATFSQGEVAH